MIELRDVRVYLNGAEVIKGVALKLEEKALLLGPNGSGKTTLLRAIAGIVPYKGSITVDGNEVRDVRNYNALVTNLPEAFSLFARLDDVIDAYEELKGFAYDVREELRKLGIPLNKRLHALSAGQSTVARTLIALATDPKVVLIDEPFESVDVAKRRLIVQRLKEYGREGLIVTHELDMARLFADWKAFLILEGRVYGPAKVSELLSSSLVVGEDPSAFLTLDVGGVKLSLVRGDRGVRLDAIGTLERLYALATGGRA
jgi:ABC-type Mn2+/Zn2+ transport system ATPase subunit